MNTGALIPPPWTLQALCAETDPEIFFPEKGESSRDAKSICGRCDVTRQCLEYSLDHQDAFGISGGTTVRERRRIDSTIPDIDDEDVVFTDFGSGDLDDFTYTEMGA